GKCDYRVYVDDNNWKTQINKNKERKKKMKRTQEKRKEKRGAPHRPSCGHARGHQQLWHSWLGISRCGWVVRIRGQQNHKPHVLDQQADNTNNDLFPIFYYQQSYLCNVSSQC